MKWSKKQILTACLLLIGILIHWYSRDNFRVESGYSGHFFPAYAGFQRQLLGKIPFSIGDFIYGLFVCWLIWKAVRGIQWLISLKKRDSAKQPQKLSIADFLIFFCSLYIIFNLSWGINYDRKGIAWQLDIAVKDKYDKENLCTINGLLTEKINTSKKSLIASKAVYPSNKELFNRINIAYQNASSRFTFLQYQPMSLKSSMWGWLGNYAGFTGYYNPFTGEAQVNTTVPSFLQPFIGCHEVAHQLGYAKEMEANFVGYLTAVSSRDTLLHYSAYLDIFMYANRNLYLIDSVSARQYRNELNEEVQQDLKEWITFNRKHRNFFAPVINWAYDKYLRGNRQPQGVLSYDEVTAFVIAYHRKFGRID